MRLYYFNLKSTRQGPFIGMNHMPPRKALARAKSVYGPDLQDMYIEAQSGRITIYDSANE